MSKGQRLLLGDDIGRVTRVPKPKVHKLAKSNYSHRTNKEKMHPYKTKRHVYK